MTLLIAFAADSNGLNVLISTPLFFADELPDISIPFFST
jgi:hypothetical protein